jgi:gamma-glutamyl-gamma-aminobutyrate hydrolase PuuD
MKNVIVSSKIFFDKYKKINFTIDQDEFKFLDKLNINIKPIPLKNNKIIFNKNIMNSDALILLGGGDLFKVKKKKINKIRDDYEKKLFRFFFKKNRPILVICRGFQLFADLHNIRLYKIKNHVRKYHRLKLNQSKFINYSKLIVNSYHNFSIKKLPIDYLNIAQTNDGSIEIAEHNTKKVLCLMFHPERKMNSKELIFDSIKNFLK